ncbi:ABC transporter permease subunit [Tomitella cavernea]|uniref:Branched-chain amino acid ABC transporter ATP-binding protein/permease n=1 Tax=Tomitella cavernea TaxID=1387982 RepID=A0ABP9C2G4_9ACTN|nr:branched-chain amino acid ABC transporter ATP-binding protein/permease [Tomitella cavernea]
MTVKSNRVGPIPLWVLPLALGIIVMFLPWLGVGYSTVRQVQLALLLSLLVSGLNLSLGFAGELALGQAAMYAGGAYTAGLLSRAGCTDIVLQILAGGSVALLIGVITGIPGLRLGRWSLAMTSFFLVLLVPDILAIFSDETGGRSGLRGIQPATLFGQPLSQENFYVVMTVVTIVWFVVMRNIVVSRHANALRVLKQSPVLSSSLGISVFRMKLLAYSLGAIPAGLAGAMFAGMDLYVSPETFSFALATTILAASVIGGSASVYGAVIGAFLMQYVTNASSGHQSYSLLITGAFLILGGVFLTGGLTGLARTLWRRFAARRSAEPVPTGPIYDDVPSVDGQLLSVEGISKAFGGNRALDGVTFTAAPGRVTALIGPNGSGKTTLLNMICGFYRADAGRITLGSSRLDGLSPHNVARAGVARTFQTPNIPADTTVLETVIAGRYAGHRATVAETILRLPRYNRVRRADITEALRVLDMVGLRYLEDAEATALPLGQRRLLEVARCVIDNPGVLLLDEVASGLDEDEVERLAELIRMVRKAGGTVVLVEHNFDLVLSLADGIVALAQGQVMADGTPEEIKTDTRVLSEYLGVEVDDGAESGGVALLERAFDEAPEGGAPTAVEGREGQ